MSDSPKSPQRDSQSSPKDHIAGFRIRSAATEGSTTKPINLFALSSVTQSPEPVDSTADADRLFEIIEQRQQAEHQPPRPLPSDQPTAVFITERPEVKRPASPTHEQPVLKSEPGNSPVPSEQQQQPQQHQQPPPKKSRLEEQADSSAATTSATAPSSPSNNCLTGMLFSISGIENPERARLRSAALRMGAQYSPQWQPDRSTHLITPFLNTPKYQQMISSGRGVALRPNYIYDCQQAGRRLEEAGYRLRDIRNYQPSDDDSEDSSDAGSSSSGDDGTTADESGYSSEGSNSEVIEIRSSPEEAEGEEQLSGEYNQDSGAPNQGALVEHQASHLDSTITHDVVPDLSRLPELPMFFTGYSFVLDECSLSLNDLNRIRRLIYEANGEIIDNPQLAPSARHCIRVVSQQDSSSFSSEEGAAGSIPTVDMKWIDRCFELGRFDPIV